MTEIQEAAPKTQGANDTIQDDPVMELRKVLAWYDEGVLTKGEVSAYALTKLLAPAMERVANGEESGWAGPYCGDSPDRGPKYVAILEFGAPGKPVWLKPMVKKPA